MNPSRKTIAVTLLAGVMTVGMPACSRDLPDEPSAGTPQADVSILQVPANDDFANAVVIGALPFTDDIGNTNEATAVDDPANDCLVDGHTVWYTFTPSVDTRINANTFGSDYDTGIAVYTGTPPSLTQIACNDDAITGQFVQSNLNFDAAAGTTYYFMVGSCCGSGGGHLVFNVSVSVNLGLTIDPTGSVDAKTGVATISGTVTCSEPVSVFLDGFIEQRVGRVILRGFFFTAVECDGATSWQVQVVADNGLFAGGQVKATVHAFAPDRDFVAQVSSVGNSPAHVPGSVREGETP
jgi:hypothetical protein